MTPKWIAVLCAALLIGCAPTQALESVASGETKTVAHDAPPSHLGGSIRQNDQRVIEKQKLCESIRSETPAGLFVKNDFVWIYTRPFAERFCMPETFVSSDIKGALGAAWHIDKTGGVTCGWGGKREACKESKEYKLTIFFDAENNPLPWRKSAAFSPEIARPLRYLVPKGCETYGKRSVSRLAKQPFWQDPCKILLEEQPFADPATNEDAFWFARYAKSTTQGNMLRVASYGKESYPNLAWVQLLFDPLNTPAETMHVTLEIRVKPSGLTEQIYHEVVLPASFVQSVLDAKKEQQTADREFYKNALDMK